MNYPTPPAGPRFADIAKGGQPSPDQGIEMPSAAAGPVMFRRSKDAAIATNPLHAAAVRAAAAKEALSRLAIKVKGAPSGY